MNASPRAMLVIALLLLLPAANAQPAGTNLEKVTTNILDDGSLLLAQDLYNFTLQSAAAFNQDPIVRVSVDSDAGTPRLNLTRGAETKPVPPASVIPQGASTDGVRVHAVNLSGLFPFANGDRLQLKVSYTQTDDLFHGRLEYAAGELVVFAGGDQPPASSELGEFAPGEFGPQATKNNPSAGFTYEVSFEPTPSSQRPQAMNMNPYLLLVLGLVAGFLLAWFLLKRKPKAKKFEKGGEMESGAMLEARRRTLMAALKELELAHEAKEIPDSAYAPLKEEYKAQTVRVLRTLEEKKETPGSKP